MRVSVAEAVRRGWIPADSPGAHASAGGVLRGRVGGGRTRCGPTPQEVLWHAVGERWPGLASLEHPAGVPGRRYRIDIAFPHTRPPLAIEVDGYRVHGLDRARFQTDRDRQNALAIAGWRVLRFYTRHIRHDLPQVMAVIFAALEPPVTG